VRWNRPTSSSSTITKCTPSSGWRRKSVAIMR
jgi:hypothetical protein